MLWQPSLPESYSKASPEDLARRIAARRRELGDSLVILGHHYQSDEVIQHADLTGDSLKLSQAAAELARARSGEESVKYVIFCGVHFMAESADMLTPDGVAVILPDLSAGCSMADMAQYDDTVQAWDTIHAALEAQGWRGRIIPITYVNSSAAIKAFVGAHGGACCTSSNAGAVFEWALRGGTALRAVSDTNGATAIDRVQAHGLESRATKSRVSEDIKIIFLPDQHLGRNTAAAHGIDVSRHATLYDPRLAKKGEELGGSTPRAVLDARVILWAGHCSVHKLFRPEHCDQVRSQDAAERTKTTILVHPECCKEVVDKADLAGSTEYIIRTIEEAPAGSRWAVGTEVHLVQRLAATAAPRGIGVRILSDCQCLCTTMYRIDQPHLLWVLDNLAGQYSKDGRARIVNQIRVHPTVRKQALLALDRMLSLSRLAKRDSVVGAVD